MEVLPKGAFLIADENHVFITARVSHDIAAGDVKPGMPLVDYVRLHTSLQKNPNLSFDEFS